MRRGGAEHRALISWLVLFAIAVAGGARATDQQIGTVTGDVGKKKTGYRYVHRYEDTTDRSADLPISIHGRVMASDRDIPLSYTNIFVMNTGRGTLALNNGQFWLRGLKPGTYTIRASYITYSIGEVTLSLLPGDDVEIEFWCRTTPFTSVGGGRMTPSFGWMGFR